MQIEQLHIRSFGHIKDLKLAELGSSLVVFLGRNESGKSTLAQFLKTMLYGFHPASAGSHPYGPWDGTKIEGELRYTRTDGGEEVVVRKLGGAPEAFLLGGPRKALRNRPVPAVSHISRELFESVYALTLSEMASVRARSWEEIQDRLIGSLGIQSLRPARKVVKELGDAAACLWRSSKRGKPKARQIEDRLRELRSAVKEAQKRDKKVRELVERRSKLDEEQSLLARRKAALSKRIRELERLVPLASLVHRMEEALATAGKPEEWQALPDDPRERLRELERAVEELTLNREDLLARLEAKQRVMAKCSPEDENLACLVGEIQRWEQSFKRLDEDESLMAEEEREATRANGSIVALSRQCLARGLDAEVEEKLLLLHVQSLRKRVKDYEGSTSTLLELRQNVERSGSFGIEGSYLPWFALALSGALVLVLGIIQNSQILLALGSLVEVLAAVLAARTGVRRGQVGRYRSSVIEPLEADVKDKAKDIAALLSGIPVASERLKSPDAYLLADLESLQRALQKRNEAHQRILVHRAGSESVISRFEEWLKANDLAPEEAAPTTVSRLLARAGLAEGRVREAREAGAASRELESSLQQVSSSLSAQQATLHHLREVLLLLGQGEVDLGIRLFEERRGAFRDAELHRKALDADFPGWASLLKERPVGSDFINALVMEEEALKCQFDEVNDLDKTASAERAALNPELEHISAGRSSADIESEISSLQEDLETVKSRRDRLLLLGNLIAEADRRFREKHQPDVLRRASEFLSLISGDRYRRIDQDEVSGAFEVYLQGGLLPVPAAIPLSQGTRDQIYLALRLAIVEHLDDGQEHLPLFLDEILVNWDSERRSKGYAVLERVLDNRQVFVFTCHPWLAREMVSSLGARCYDFSELGPKTYSKQEAESRFLLV